MHSTQPKYLFVSLDSGVSFTTDREPTPTDLEQVAVGLGTIIRVADLLQWSKEGSWEPVLPGVITTPDVPGHEHEQFHVHPSWL
jgi:hypothetical protein